MIARISLAPIRASALVFLFLACPSVFASGTAALRLLLGTYSLQNPGDRSPLGTDEVVPFIFYVSNTGPDEARDVRISIDLPDGVEVVHTSMQGTWPPIDEGSCDEGRHPRVCTFSHPIVAAADHLGAEPYKQINLDLRMPSVDGTLTVTASVTSSTDDPDPSDNQGSISRQVVSTSNLYAFLGSTGMNVDPGDTTTLKLDMSNLAGRVAHGVVALMTVPDGFELVSSKASRDVLATCTQKGTEIRCEADGFRPLDVSEVLLTIRIPASSPGGRIWITVNVTSTTPELDPSNNTYSANIDVFHQIRVTNTNDSGPASLRDAMEEANRTCDGSLLCKVAFAIPLPVPTGGVFTIRPRAPLPTIRACLVEIDGATQKKIGGDWNANGPAIQINGSEAGNSDGLVLAPRCGSISELSAAAASRTAEFIVNGLVINGFSGNGISISAEAGNAEYGISNNYIGTDPTGRSAVPNSLRGVSVGSPRAVTYISGNVVSGNGRSGLFLWEGLGHSIGSNMIGTAADKTSPVPNGASGIYVTNRCGDTEIAYNAIGGNRDAGLMIDRNTPLVQQYYNSFHGNGGGSIDIGLDGPTPNDDDESDGVWNHPVLTEALYDPGTRRTIVRGYLASAAPASRPQFQIAVYSAETLRGDGMAEAEQSDYPVTNVSGPYHQTTGVKVPFKTPFEISISGDLRGKYVMASSHHIEEYELFVSLMNTSELGPPIPVR